VVLTPREASMYGRLRKQPRKEWVSTLEAIGDVLPALGEPEAVRSNLRRLLRTLLQRTRDKARIAP
jgi:DTW domain-containing protein YfiP